MSISWIRIFQQNIFCLPAGKTKIAHHSSSFVDINKIRNAPFKLKCNHYRPFNASTPQSQLGSFLVQFIHIRHQRNCFSPSEFRPHGEPLKRLVTNRWTDKHTVTAYAALTQHRVVNTRYLPGQAHDDTVRHVPGTWPPNEPHTLLTCPPWKSLCPRKHHRHVPPNHHKCRLLSFSQSGQRHPEQQLTYTT